MASMKKKTRKYVWIAVVVVIASGIVWKVSSGESESASAYSQSTLVADETDVYDFGTINMKDGDVTKKYTLKNIGDEAVRIEKVYTSCMCTTAYVEDASGERRGGFGMQGHSGPSKTNITIKPGEEATLEAIFDPAAHGPSGVGLASRSVYVETNSSTSPKLEVRFKAMVTN